MFPRTFNFAIKFLATTFLFICHQC